MGADQRDCPVAAADPADDGAEHVGEFRADEEETLRVGLARVPCLLVRLLSTALLRSVN